MTGAIQRFLEAMREESPAMRVFVLWNASNTVLAAGLLVGAFALLVVTSAPGFQREVLLAYIAVAVAWLVSIFTIGPAFERFGPGEG